MTLHTSPSATTYNNIGNFDDWKDDITTKLNMFFQESNVILHKSDQLLHRTKMHPVLDKLHSLVPFMPTSTTLTPPSALFTTQRFDFAIALNEGQGPGPWHC
eukprot:5125699-Ditylum_brightwellii.AAC.1